MGAACDRCRMGAHETSERMPRRIGMQARVAGIFYLLTIVGGVFAETVATAGNLPGAQQLFRAGVAAELMMLCAYVVVTWLLYEIFEPVDRRIAGLSAIFSVVGIATLAAFSLAHLAALAAGESGNATFAVKLHGMGYDISDVFFGVYCLLIGWLVLRSTLIHKAIGVLMAIAGFAYLANTFADVLFPVLGRAMEGYALLPALIGELALTLWLIAFGIKRESFT